LKQTLLGAIFSHWYYPYLVSKAHGRPRGNGKSLVIFERDSAGGSLLGDVAISVDGVVVERESGDLVG